MSLSEIVDNSRTDKNTVHSYLDLYETLLVDKKLTAKNVLEIGIGDGAQGISNGGSIKLWHDYFQNATIYGLDVKKISDTWDGIKNNKRICLGCFDAYNEFFFKTQILSKNIKFDMMLDDGPHTLESMKKFIRLYSQIISDDGILIIEDIPDWKWIEILTNETPQNLKKFIKSYDLRPIKSRYDDIVFTIDKNNV